jgi:hypothetical protein
VQNLDYVKARSILNSLFVEVENEVAENEKLIFSVPSKIETASNALFNSRTQAYRETMLGCVLARTLDRTADIRLPYVNQGRNAFNGRTLDEQVVNPFLNDNRIPCSKGPYLSAFRRSVRFDGSTRKGVRDKSGYDCFLTMLTYVRQTNDDATLQGLLKYLLLRFVRLRESADIPRSRLQRMSLDQYKRLISRLVATPSGGRFPLLLAVSTFRAIKEHFKLQDWEISSQGINVADAASGAGGDITIASKGAILMAAEVTERPIDRARVVSTFNTKIVQSGIEDYLFLGKGEVEKDVRAQAYQYFAQGHEVNFLDLGTWIYSTLATIGSRGRVFFNQALLDGLNKGDVPQSLKAAWNKQLEALTRD